MKLARGLKPHNSIWTILEIVFLQRNDLDSFAEILRDLASILHPGIVLCHGSHCVSPYRRAQTLIRRKQANGFRQTAGIVHRDVYGTLSVLERQSAILRGDDGQTSRCGL